MARNSSFTTIPQIFKYLTEEFPQRNEKPIFQEKLDGAYRDISYQEFYEETEQVALGLIAVNIKRGEKLAIISENRPEWAYADFAILGIGAIDIPLYPILTADSIEFILNNSEASVMFVSNKFQLNKVMKVWKKCKALKHIVVFNDIDTSEYENVHTFRELKQKGLEFKKENPNYFREGLGLIKEDDVATIIYTSGTTGEPKGVVLTHKNIISNVKAAHEVYDMDEKDTFLSFLPLCHIFERMAGYYTALSAGSTVAFAESIEKIAINMEEIKPTLMTAVPRLFERIYNRVKRNVDSQPEKKQKMFQWALETGKEFYSIKRTGGSMPITLNMKYKLADKLVLSKVRMKTGGNLRYIISGGAALARVHGEFFEAIGVKVLEGYGLTESSPVIAANRINNYKFGSVGQPFPGVEVKIASDGEILVHGPNVMQGYYKNKKETDAVLKNGWLHTGDIGVFDAQGFLIITDRKKHLFKTSNGKYVAPSPIENMFLASKYIDQFVLIGDRRMFMSALIVPDYEAIKEYADANRIQYSSLEELVNMKQIYELLDKDLSQFQKKLANFERVRKFTILEKPFTIETGEMTPSLKLKRKVIEERYGNLIDEMYKGLEA